MANTRNVSEVFADTFAQGGGTYDADTFARVDFADGYVVALPDGEVIGPLASSDAAGRVIRDAGYRARSLRGGHYVGTWQDGENVHVDVVAHVANREDAIALGVERDQVSVWDCANDCEIPTGGNGSASIVGA
jgi:hypothetical protein